jgi:hypothetical protein
MKSKHSDFPDWFGPMLVKELRQGLKTRGFVFSFIGLQALLVFVLIYHVLLYARNPKDFDASGLGAIFWFLIGGLLIFVTPMRAFNELAAERKANTLELIFMSGLSAWRIAFGKWVSLLFQALLFLLAVLPFAILRYYFGAVDLAQDLQGMLLVMLGCAVLSALALAISGMPLWVRIFVIIVAVFFFMIFSMGIIPMLLFGRYMGSSSLFGWVPDASWALIGWDIVVVCLVALQVAAATVAPPAENHAGRQRLLTLLLWLPLPIMRARGVAPEAQFGQLLLFTGVAGWLIWYQLSVRPVLFQSHLRPFRGWRALLGLPLQPGWPSTVLFLLIDVALYAWMMPNLTPAANNTLILASGVMSSAALLGATLFWLALLPRARYPLLVETLFTILCGVAVALIMAGKPSGTHLGEQYWFAFIPATAMWAMLDQSYTYSVSVSSGMPTVNHSEQVALIWLYTAYLAVGGYALVLLICSRKYWVRYFRTCLALARPTSSPELIPAPAPSEP